MVPAVTLRNTIDRGTHKELLGVGLVGQRLVLSRVSRWKAKQGARAIVCYDANVPASFSSGAKVWRTSRYLLFWGTQSVLVSTLSHLIHCMRMWKKWSNLFQVLFAFWNVVPLSVCAGAVIVCAAHISNICVCGKDENSVDLPVSGS